MIMNQEFINLKFPKEPGIKDFKFMEDLCRRYNTFNPDKFAKRKTTPTVYN